MSSTTNGMCGTEGSQLAERSDVQPFQGWGVGTAPTQGCATLALGFGIQPPWGLRSKPRRNSEVKRTAAQQCHAGDATAVSTVCSDGNDAAFVGCSEVTEGAPLMAVRSAARVTPEIGVRYL